MKSLTLPRTGHLFHFVVCWSVSKLIVISLLGSSSSIWHLQPLRVWASSFLRLHDHTQGHHSRLDSSGRVIGPSQRPLLDNTYNRQTSMPPAEFEPAIPAGDRPQTHTLDRSATGIGSLPGYSHIYNCFGSTQHFLVLTAVVVFIVGLVNGWTCFLTCF